MNLIASSLLALIHGKESLEFRMLESFLLRQIIKEGGTAENDKLTAKARVDVARALLLILLSLALAPIPGSRDDCCKPRGNSNVEMMSTENS